MEGWMRASGAWCMLGRADEVTQHINAACLPAAHTHAHASPPLVLELALEARGEMRLDNRNTRQYAIKTGVYSTLPDPRNIPHVTCL